MNRTDRMLAILLELQSHGQLRAEDLARTFEVSKRTIYRDIQALSETGIPIVAMTGHGYSLPAGFFLPPLSFNSEEALMLLLGSRFMAEQFDEQYRRAAQAAERKIRAVLPPEMQAQVSQFEQEIVFFAAQSSDGEAARHKLRLARRAIAEKRVLRFIYQKKIAADRPTEREIEPHGLAHLINDWYVMGFCLLRQARRVFRLNRMSALELLDQPHAHPHPPASRLAWVNPDQERPLTIRALLSHEAGRWLDEYRPIYLVSDEKQDNGILLTLTVRHLDEAFQWLLSWGSQLTVLEPEELRERLREEGEKLFKNYQ